MSDLRRGDDGDPLPAGEWVRRAFKKKTLTMAGEINELQFAPSTEDKQDPKHRLTVWAERLTRDEHIFTLSNNDPAESILARLNADAIRGLRPEPSVPDIPRLEVEWHADPRPHAEGHAGIRDLLEGQKLQRKSLRVQLAALAQRGLVG